MDIHAMKQNILPDDNCVSWFIPALPSWQNHFCRTKVTTLEISYLIQFVVLLVNVLLYPPLGVFGITKDRPSVTFVRRPIFTLSQHVATEYISFVPKTVI